MEMLIAIKERSAAIDDIKAGQVITIQPDGWPWTPIELSNPDWHIICAPILNTDAAVLMQPHSMRQKKGDVKYPSMQNLLDLSKLPHSDLQNKIRTVQKVNLQRSDIVAAKVTVT